MAGSGGTTDRDLTGGESPVSGWSFFQLVQHLERLYRPRARVGRQGPPWDELIRFRPEASLGFPSADVVGVERSELEGGQPRFAVTTTFLGLYGASSPLPTFYTEEILSRDPEHDAVREFLDLFHHRLLSLFYRAWEKYRYPAQYQAGGSDEFSQRLFSLIGLGTKGLAETRGDGAVQWLRYAGVLTMRSRSGAALEGVLSDAFSGVPVTVEPYVGRWVAISPDQRCALGRSNCRLGTDAVIGERVYGLGSAFRIAMGPMDFTSFTGLLPGGSRAETLQRLVKLFLRDPLDFDVALKVIASDIPRLQLGAESRAGLGWSTWLYGEDQERPEMERLEIALSDQHSAVRNRHSAFSNQLSALAES